jgi:3-oxoacyl-[acyl-carrier-protein] synthase-3
MYVVGAGFSCPETELSDEFLLDLGLALDPSDSFTASRCGVKTRRVSLPLDYIASTRNRDAVAGRTVATVSPTELAARAARQAMERAGITGEQIGLIIAETATPYETCPGEAQRVGGALGLKVCAYDVVGGANVLPLYVETLLNWKPERIPEYVLCISTNTPSQNVSFVESSVPAYLFGDGAAALILSPRQTGKLTVTDSYLRRQGSYRSAVILDRHVSLSASSMLAEKELFQMMVQGLNRLSEKVTLDLSSAYFIGPQLYAGDIVKFDRELGLRPEQICSPVAEQGYSLGASVGSAISALWDQVRPGQQIAVLHAGDGQFSGIVLSASE